MLYDLKQVWQECFLDDMAYIDFYFKHMAGDKNVYENILVKVVEDKPVSMLTMIPSSVWIQGKRKNIFYIYAVATSKAYRKKGYAAGLLSYAYELAQKTNAALMLVPASKELFSYYEKLGFRTAFWMEKRGIDLTSNNCFDKDLSNRKVQKLPYEKTEINADTYGQMRTKHFCQEGDVIWDRQQIHYAWEENEYLCGKSYWIIHHAVDYFLMGCPIEGVYYIREHNLPKELVEEVGRDLAKEHACMQISIKSKVPCFKENKQELGNEINYAYGMVYPKETFIQAGYLGLALD